MRAVEDISRSSDRSSPRFATSASRTRPGAGLGLAICKQLVELAGRSRGLRTARARGHRRLFRARGLPNDGFRSTRPERGDAVHGAARRPRGDRWWRKRVQQRGRQAPSATRRARGDVQVRGYEESRERRQGLTAPRTTHPDGLDEGAWRGNEATRRMSTRLAEGSARAGAVRVAPRAVRDPWRGDIVQVVREATVLFLTAYAMPNRPDIKAVVEATTSRKANRTELSPTDPQTAPPAVLRSHRAGDDAAPRARGGDVEGGGGSGRPHAVRGGRRPEAGRAGREGRDPARGGGRDGAVPRGVQPEAGQGRAGAGALPRCVPEPPQPLARWDATYCQTRTLEDELCFPRVDAEIGYTHDERGRRLLTNRGEPLPAGYVDPNALN